MGRRKPSDARVASLMTRSLITLGHRTPVGAAWQLMRSRKVHHLPVVDDDRRLVGIITDHDLQQAILDLCVRHPEDVRQALGSLQVDEIMTWGVIAVGPDTGISQAARIMRERKVGALPVTDEGRIVGMLTATDVVESLLEARGRSRAHQA